MSRLWKVAFGTLGVAALLLVLFPVFQKPAENRRYDPAYGCMINMKQLGLASIQYMQDNDETFPTAAAATGKDWREATYFYVKSVGVYRCPSDTSGISPDTLENLPKSYAANSALLGHSLASVSSNNIFAADTRGFDGEDWDIRSPAFLPSTGRTLYAHFPKHPFYEHPSGGLNVLYIDGHVKRLPPMNTLTPINLWTRDNAPFTGQDLANAQAILRHAEKE